MGKLATFFGLLVLSVLCFVAFGLFDADTAQAAGRAVTHSGHSFWGRVIGFLILGMAANGAASAGSNNFSSIWHKILGAVWSDEMAKSTPMWGEYLEEKTTVKKYFDDVEMVDSGLWSETDEGNDLDLDDFGEGIKTRYEVKKFAKRLIIPEELEEDGQYPEAYDASRILARTGQLTQDYDAVGMLNNMFDTTVTWGDGQAWMSASHPIRGGGTVSNVLATPLSPSNTAVQAMIIIAEKMPGTNGFRHGLKLLKIVCPTNQRFRFAEILKSEKKDDTSNNAVNALAGELQAKPVAVPFMSSTTNWMGKTNAMRGALFVWKRKPRFRQTSEFSNETKIFTASARWVTGVSNFRSGIGSQS